MTIGLVRNVFNMSAHCNPDDGIEAVYYITAPKDIIVIKPCDLNDHVKWLLDRQMYGQALEDVAKADPQQVGLIKAQAIIEIGLKYINALVNDGFIFSMT
jgi:hypothetical protein